SHTSSCSFTVTVADNQGPVFSNCPMNLVKGNDSGQCTAVATYAPTASDVCDGARTVTCMPASGTAFPKGVTTVTCTASDASSNSNSCSFTVTVNDTENPTIMCPANQTANSPSGNPIPVTYPAPTVNDNCPGASFMCSPASGSNFAVGTTTVTCTASDTATPPNPAMCQFTVTVTTCTISCPGNQMVNATAGACNAPVSYVAPTTT